MAKLKNKAAYRVALKRVEDLAETITEDTPKTDKNFIEYSYLSELVEEYEKAHLKTDNLTLISAIKLRMYERDLTQKDVAKLLHISQPHVSTLLNGKFEPSLETARRIAVELDIDPAIVLGIKKK